MNSATLRQSILAAIVLASPSIAESEAPAPPSVVVAPATMQELQKQEEFVGRVIADQSVDLQARVEGVLEEINFTEGGTVKKGDNLFRIEKRKYSASVESAQAALKSAQASAQSDQAALDRQKTLFDKGDIPQSVLDTALAAYAEGQAAVDEAQAALKIAQMIWITLKSPALWTDGSDCPRSMRATLSIPLAVFLRRSQALIPFWSAFSLASPFCCANAAMGLFPLKASS